MLSGLSTRLTWPARIAGLLLFGLLGGACGSAAEWQVQPVDLPGPVTEIRQGDGTVYLRTDAWMALSPCEGGLCTAPASPPQRETEPGGIPGGYVATSSVGDVTRAWYADPTDRYPHAVLGDGIEGGALEVVAHGRQVRLVLDQSHVFEDIAPRIVDLDGDGRNEVVAIRSSAERGGGLVVYGVRNGALVEIAAALPLDRPFRWLNVAGIDDFDGDGRKEIAIVVTPHLAGILQVWDFAGVDGRLNLLAEAGGYSNHAIGMSELAMSAVVDVDGGAVDLVLPSLDRRSLRFVGIKNGRLTDLGDVSLGGEAHAAIGHLEIGGKPLFVVGLRDGRVVAVSPG